MSLVTVIMLFAPLGANKSLLRFLPEFRNKKRRLNDIVGISFLTAICGGVFSGVILFFLSPYISKLTFGNYQFVLVLQIVAVLIPIRSVLLVLTDTFRALKLIRPQVVMQHIADPIFQLVAVLLAFLFGYSLYGVIGAVVVGTSLSVAVGFIALYYYTEIHPSISGEKAEIVSYFKFSIPITFRDLGGALYSKTDILMLGWFVSSASVGRYNIAVLLATLIALPLSGFNQIFPSFASELYHSNEHEKLSTIQSILIRWTLTISLFTVAFMGVFRIEILSIFGEEFLLAELSFLLLISGQLIDSIAFGSGYYLSASDHQYVLLMNQWFFGGLNVVLNYIGITYFGITGAALATATVISLQNITRIIESWHFENHFPYQINTLKIIPPAMGGLFVMALIQRVLEGYLSVGIGGVLGFVAYSVLLYSFGFEKEDVMLLRKLILQTSQK